MVKITFSSPFIKAFKKKIKGKQNIESNYWEKIDIFIKNPFDAQLRTHKLSVKLEGMWSFTIEYDLRVNILFFRKG